MPIKLCKIYSAWRKLHMLEITVDEFLDKAAALKGNVEVLMAQQQDEHENVDDNDQELEERPPIQAAGRILSETPFKLTKNSSETKFRREFFRSGFRTGAFC